MDFESIMLSKISQTEKAKHLRSRLYVESKKKSVHRNREQIGGYQQQGLGKWMKVVKRYKLSVKR